MGSTKIIIAAIVIIAVAGGAYIFTRPQQTTTTTETPVEQGAQEEVIEDEGVIIDDTNENAVTFEMTGKNFEFSKKNLTVKKGQTVIVKFTSESGFHDWTIGEFNVATNQVNTGESSEVTFVADKVGEFEYYCSVGQHRQLGMVGTLTVTE